MNNNKSKIILFGACLVLIVIAYVFFVYNPMQTKIRELKQAKQDAQSKEAAMAPLQDEMKNFDIEFAELKDRQTAFMTSIPRELKQENVLVLLKDLMKMPAGVPPITIKPISFSKVSVSKDVGGENAGGEITGEAIDTALQMDVTISGQGTYDSIKQFLKNVMNCKPKVVAKNITLTIANASANLLTYDMTLSFYSYKGKNDGGYFTNQATSEIQDIFRYHPAGLKYKSNIFQPILGAQKTSSALVNNNVSTKSAGEKAGVFKTGNDFGASLTPMSYDSPSFSIGKSGNGLIELSQKKNGISNAELVLEQKNGQYYFKYKMNDKSYPKDYITFDKFVPVNNSFISFVVIGSDIMRTKDHVAANISISNNTDLPVNVQVLGIPQNSGKLQIIQKSGIVKTNWM